MRLPIPFQGILLLVKTELIAFLPQAPVLSVLTTFLVGDEITAHALIQGTAIQGLGGPSDAILATVDRRALAFAIDVVEENLLHLKKLTCGNEGRFQNDSPLDKFGARRLGERSLVPVEPRAGNNGLMKRIPFSIFLSLAAEVAKVLLKFRLHILRFVEDSALMIFFGKFGSYMIAEGIVGPGTQTTLLSAKSLALGHVGIVHLLELIDHLLNAIIVLFVGVDVKQHRNGRSAALLVGAVQNHKDLIFGRITLALHGMLGWDLDVDVQDRQLISPLLGHVGTGTLDLIVDGGIAESTLEFAIVHKPKLVGQNLFFHFGMSDAPFALFASDLMILKALRGGLIKAHVDGRLPRRLVVVIAHVLLQIRLDVLVKLIPVIGLVHLLTLEVGPPLARTAVAIVGVIKVFALGILGNGLGRKGINGGGISGKVCGRQCRVVCGTEGWCLGRHGAGHFREFERIAFHGGQHESRSGHTIDCVGRFKSFLGFDESRQQITGHHIGPPTGTLLSLGRRRHGRFGSRRSRGRCASRLGRYVGLLELLVGIDAVIGLRVDGAGAAKLAQGVDEFFFGILVLALDAFQVLGTVVRFRAGSLASLMIKEEAS